jgi:hypothetical protein
MSLLTFCVGGTLRNSTFRRKAHMMILTGSIARSSQMVGYSLSMCYRTRKAGDMCAGKCPLNSPGPKSKLSCRASESW